MDKTRILIIDDEPSFTRMVKLNLEDDLHFIVRQENNSLNGLKAAKEFKPHLIFCDIIMPEMDGGDVASQIRNESDLKDIPIIFLSAVVSQEESHDGSTFYSGGERFLAKPVTVDSLIRCIKETLGDDLVI